MPEERRDRREERRDKREERREKIKRAGGKSAGAEGVCYSTSPPSGNQVDGLPLVCHDTTPPQNDRVSKVLIDEAYEDVKKIMSSGC